MYGVEYYSETIGCGIEWFNTADERDIWLMYLDIDNFYLITRESK